MTGSAERVGIAVGVRSRVDGTGPAGAVVTAGVLVDATVVAYPIDRGVDYRPVEVEVVIAAAPQPDGAVERIAADQVDLMEPSTPLAGRAVAFATLARPCSLSGELPMLSPQQLTTAMRQAGDLWRAVITVCGHTGAPPAPPDEVLRSAGPAGDRPPPTLRVHPARSFEQLAINWCDITPRCFRPPV